MSRSTSSTRTRPIADPLELPIVVVSPPRAGSRLIGAALRGVPGTWSVTDDEGGLLAGLPALDPRRRDQAGRLDAAAATPDVCRVVRERLRARVPAALSGAPSLRLVDAAPRSALMVPFLARVLPDARFVYVHRRLEDALADALTLWRSGAAVTYPELAGWDGPPWSFLLVPGWQRLRGRPLAEVVTEQWVTTMEVLVGDLESLAPGRWCVVDHAALLTDPRGELERLFRFLGLPRAAAADAVLELSPRRLDQAVVSEARRELEPYVERARTCATRAQDWFASEP